jgi:molybdopterin converting factor subunit 1
MKVTVKLFASFREAAGAPSSVVEIEQGTTISQLWGSMVETYPRLARMRRIASFAVNGQYTRSDLTLNDGDEVAFLPPVSGG